MHASLPKCLQTADRRDQSIAKLHPRLAAKNQAEEKKKIKKSQKYRRAFLWLRNSKPLGVFTAQELTGVAYSSV